MTAVPSGSAPVWVIPADDAGDEDVDVLSLAGRQPPAGGCWLWVTAAEPRRGGEFTALALPGNRPLASGGDVLVHLAPSPGWETAGGTPVADVQVWAVVAGSLLLVAGWHATSLSQWPENVRIPVVFAQGVLRELQDHGADTGSREQVDVIAAAGSVPAAFPALPVRVSAAG